MTHFNKSDIERALQTPASVSRAIEILGNNQREDELSSRSTNAQNGVGFTSCWASAGTHLWQFVTGYDARTRTNKIGPDELSGGTFTITNLGSVGALFDTPIINQPQVAILGPGAVVKRPVVIDDPNLGETIAVRHMVYLALTYDHRLVDGADAGRFLQEVKQRLESGSFEV